jgi:hypothetical protein
MAITLVGFMPPNSISRLISNGVARQLFYVVWHFALLLPAVILLTVWEGSERKCFVHALLACYFVALPLESGRRMRLVLANQPPAAPTESPRIQQASVHPVDRETR